MNGKFGWKTFLVIALFVLIVFLFISSLGQYNPTGIAKPDEFKDDREKAKLIQVLNEYDLSKIF